MWLIYALLMLDGIKFILILTALLSGGIWLVGFILSMVGDAESGKGYNDFTENQKKVHKKLRNGAIKIFIPALLLACFVPNSKQTAIIFTISNTIEYVQGNEKLKELPDKAVACLDKFVSEYLSEDSVNNQ